VDSEVSLIWGVIFWRGRSCLLCLQKKQQRFVPSFCGIGLMAFPYFTLR
jgi:hypothetical protein